MSTIILDLDHTLLDTTSLTAALAASLDISVSQWEQAYQQFVEANGHFSSTAFLRGASADEKERFEAVVKKCRHYLYSDVLEWLRQLQTKDWRCIILTVGDQTWQRDKLTALEFPKSILTVVVPDSKVNHLAEYPDDVVIVVDDRVTELDAIAEKLPNIQRYLIQRPNGKYLNEQSKFDHHIITSLNDIKL